MIVRGEFAQRDPPTMMFSHTAGCNTKKNSKINASRSPHGLIIIICASRLETKQKKATETKQNQADQLFCFHASFLPSRKPCRLFSIFHPSRDQRGRRRSGGLDCFAYRLNGGFVLMIVCKS